MDRAKNRAWVRGVAAATAAAALALTLTACGGDGGGKKPDDKTSTPAAASGGKSQSQSNAPSTQNNEVLATVTGGDGIEIVVNSAKRDTGGFVTVEGVVANNSSQGFTAPGWQGSEQELRDNGASMAGASLVDKTGKKRYLILRDTDGRCLCTRFPTGLTAGQKIPFYAQFPAPPANVTDVDFQLPTMPTATIKISG
ncbi:hypothetical protein BG418_27115 [Streptomyces sp. CBMA152]|nr:hypothetical protein [Streptomyces sp. CBMA152]MBD0745311.1 hypothetical protein [Streptomyces sp. CBMA152]